MDTSKTIIYHFTQQEIDENNQAKWYKKMYQTLHKAQNDGKYNCGSKSNQQLWPSVSKPECNQNQEDYNFCIPRVIEFPIQPNLARYPYFNPKLFASWNQKNSPPFKLIAPSEKVTNNLASKHKFLRERFLPCGVVNFKVHYRAKHCQKAFNELTNQSIT